MCPKNLLKKAQTTEFPKYRKHLKAVNKGQGNIFRTLCRYMQFL